jgi:hypothetical protein
VHLVQIGDALLSKAMSPLAAESLFAAVCAIFVVIALLFAHAHPPSD